MLWSLNFCILSVVWIFLGGISFTRINEYSMNEAANEILYPIFFGGGGGGCNKVVAAVNIIR
jgi:hypothetical protein